MGEEVQPPVGLPVGGQFVFGEVLVSPTEGGGYRLCHRDDRDRQQEGPVYPGAEAALALGRTDDSGNYRPLKTAPNLRRGWQLNVGSAAEMELALDYFYPGRLAMVKARAEGRLTTTSLRETLGRQTGMYRVAANISDAQLDCLVADFCRSDSGCLRTILWKRDQAGTIASTKLPPEKFDPTYDQALSGGAEPIAEILVPLLCQESCSLLVNECRKVVKEGRVEPRP